MKIKYFILILTNILLLQIGVSYAQPGIKLTTKSKKAEKSYNKATQYYRINPPDYELIELELKRAVSADPEFIEAYMLLGDIYSDQKRRKESIEVYRKATEINPDFFPPNFYNLANEEIKSGHYENALKHYEKYLKFPHIPEKHIKHSNRMITNCEFGIYALANPVLFEPKNIGLLANSEHHDYVNAITADGKTLYITVRLPADEYTSNKRLNEEEDFYYSKKDLAGNWTKAIDLGTPVNTNGNEGAISISPDGKQIFYAACNRPGGYGSCDIYYSERERGRWTNPVNLGPLVNSKYWDTQPSIASDGKTLYFTSTRPGGKGSSDIWQTTRLEDDSWTKPVNLGDSINSEFAEMTPLIHPDNQTLYFSSNGHYGLGGKDLFMAQKNEEGIWKSPVNLGYPINTHTDEQDLIVNAKGDLAYFSSDKLGGRGKYDIYQFELYKAARPHSVTYMKGKVYDKDSRVKLKAKFELIDLETEKVVVESYSEKYTGEFLVCIPTNRNYALNVSKKGYSFYSDNFSLEGEHSNIKPFLKDVPLQPIKVNDVVILKNIFFEHDKYDLRDESEVELKKLIDFLDFNPGIYIELGGHTDNDGELAYNQKLSENRALAVYNYLVKNGVNVKRLSYKGYGETMPVDTNETTEGKANNRRTEFKIIK